MVDKVDMSLDDIIKQNRQSNPQYRRRGGPGGGRGGLGSGSVRRRGGGGGQGRISRSGGIQKRRPSFGGGGRNFQRGGGDINGRWLHDLYDNNFSRGGRANVGGGHSKLLVSNLDFGVSNIDIQELFVDFGPLKSATIHYDKSGRSLGTADIVYERKSDAIKALKQYNGVPLDGRPMNIQMATDMVSIGARPATGRVPGGRPAGLGRSPRGRSRGGPSNRQPRTGGRGGGARRKPASKPTADQLDAELDAYVNKVK